MKFSLATILICAATAYTVSAQEADNSTKTEPNLDTTAPAAADGALQTIPEIASANDDFTTLVSLLSQAKLVDTLSGTGPFTVFAPNNEAFAAVDKQEKTLLPCLQLEMFSDQLTEVLTYHVASGDVMSTDLSDGQQIPMLEGEDVKVTIIGKDILLNSDAVIDGTQVVAGDIEASNGVIHIINGVLLPPKFDVKEFLVQCRETNPDLDPVVGGEEDKDLQEDDSSASNLLSSVVVVAVVAAVVTVFGM